MGILRKEREKMDQWNAKLYDHAHHFVSEYGQDGLGLLNPQPKEHILDLGCGTGDIARKLHEMDVHVVGVDYSENMIQQARAKYPDIHFKVQDIVSLDFKEQFDAVYSNAVLHWIKHPKQALECIYASLKKEGRFVAEFGGEGNVKNITEALIQARTKFGYADTDFPWYYPSIGTYTSLMERVGFKVEFAALIDRPTKLQGENGLRHWLQMFAESFFIEMKEQDKKKVMSYVEQLLKIDQFHANHWIADYKRLRIKAIKA